MDVAKLVFDSIDKVFDKRLNKSYHIEGSNNVVITKDVLYSDSDIKTCKMDCYYVPKHTGLYPVLLYIHGGGFVAGDKEYRKALCTWYAVDGLFVVNVNYGLSPDCHYPTPITHLVAALNWIVKFAKILRLDLDKIIVGGDSAGAYYAAMLATICNNQELQKVFKVKPRATFAATILNCGLYDIDMAINNRMVLDVNKKIFASYTGCNEDDFENYKYKDYYSPIKHLDENFPPSFFAYSKRDIFCKGQTELLIGTLEHHDVYYESYHTISAIRNHCFSLDWSSRESKEANALIKDFVQKVINGTLPKKISETPIKIREHERLYNRITNFTFPKDDH
ncbi:MAG: alpha/beta hydrolase fold domain-containing protein [Clostridia bacterium]|nr:alpha/beta hydrolase fold domain-containing protein [Clostridia bacterium]